ncbi:MAG: PIN domain-containing protein [Caldilineaceae bacterium]|nr:PIN domain-containing protein [Caldilineaceae bacterium]
MSVFVDTSAFVSMLNGDEPEHKKAIELWNELQDHDEQIITTNYVIVERIALIQRRLGFDALRLFHNNIIPVLEIEWIREQQHNDVFDALLLANRRQLSFVDCASFFIIRQQKVQRVFALDKHFREQGFQCIP